MIDVISHFGAYSRTASSLCLGNAGHPFDKSNSSTRQNGCLHPPTGLNDLLSLKNIQVLYNRAIEAVRDVSLDVPAGAMVALLGSNGAGKSTILKAISGILYREDGEIVSGSIQFDSAAISGRSPQSIITQGLIQVPEGRALFATLTVEENLLMGGITRTRAESAEALERVYAMFPRVKDRRTQISGYLSGGEQQMVAIGRALMGRPRLLMLDEPSLGLAPQIIDVIFETIVELNRDTGLTVLLVEQNAHLALQVASYGYIIENGRIVMDGPAERLRSNDDVQEFYLGFSGGERKSMRDVKHYKRRKRWLS
ncbi:MAG: transporter ATP-binding protein [Rhizobium sp.]|nr:transporter ATP-binding protein [Rhizobium sp.]